MTFENFVKDKNMRVMVDMLKDAKGVFIAPQVLRGAFVVGASGGSGVFIARDKDNRWSGPAFYTLGSVSVGFQVGGDASEVILVAMTERGVKAFHSTNFKLGADAGVAVGPAGAGYRRSDGEPECRHRELFPCERALRRPLARRRGRSCEGRPQQGVLRQKDKTV